MSAFLLGMGFRADMGTCIRKLVLLKLIDACEDDGSRIFPAIATVARAAQCSDRQVQREIRAFVEIGLLSLVREGGKGRRSTNEYAMNLDVLSDISKAGWDAVAAAEDRSVKGDTESPLDDSAKGDTHVTDRVTPETAKGDNGSRTTPPDPSLDPSIERDARAQDQNQKQIERWVRRVHPNWPTHVGDSTPGANKAAMSLTADDRDEAEKRMADYVAAAKAGGRKTVCSFAKYLSEKRWEKLPPPAEQPFNEMASPFSKAWGAWIVAHLLTAPDESVKGWPLVAGLYRKAVLRQGFRFARRWHGLGSDFVAVPVGSEMFARWRAEFERRGWPWMPDPGEQPVVYLPAGGPDALQEFERAISDSQAKEAAE